SERIINQTVAHKCDLCEGRRDSPACQAVCPTGAIKLLTTEQLTRQREKRQTQTALNATADRYLLRRNSSLLKNKTTSLAGFLALARLDAEKKPLTERKTSYNEIYHSFTAEQTNKQASRCFSCGSHSICEWTCPLHNRIPHWLKLIKEGKVIEAAQ